MAAELNDVIQLFRVRRKVQGREDFARGRAHWKRQRRAACVHPFPLEKGVRDGGEHDMMMPSRIRAAFEVVEAEFGLELLILLLDRPALMREPDQLLHRGGGRQVDEEVFGARRRAQILFAQQPDLGRQSSIAPVVGGVTRTAAKRAAQGRLVPLRQVTRRHARARQRQRQGAHGDRTACRARAPAAIAAGPCAHSAGHGRRRAGKHREMPRDPDGIRQAPAVQRSPEGGDVAELGVGEHGGDLQPAARARRINVSA